MTGRSSGLIAAGIAGLTILVGAGVTFRRPGGIDPSLTAIVTKGSITASLTVGGILRPAESITYRSPLGSRETQITFLVEEGTRVNEGDLVVRLDTADLERELERVAQEVRQAQVDFQVADIESQEGQAVIDSIDEGEGALTVDEARARRLAAEKKTARLRTEFETLKPLMDKGFITREELGKTSDALESAEEELALASRKADVLLELTRPRDRRRAELQLAQKQAQKENVRARLQETEARLRVLRDQIDSCSLYARRAGLVVYEEYLGASPRRKIRVGDRVGGSHGLVTIPEVNRMLVEASVSEADVYRVQPGQRAAVLLEAFPGVRLTGKVTRVGTLAASSPDRSIEDKRFDLIVEVDPTDTELRPEMTARVDVVLGERRGVLTVPINAVFERDGVTVAHVIRAWTIETRPIQVGDSTDVAAEVLAGLQEGERVALTDVGDTGVSSPTASAGGGAATGVKRGLNSGRGALEPR